MNRRAFVAGLLAAATHRTIAAQVQPRLLGISGNADAFFDDGAVHEIRLVINTRDWQSLKDHFLENTYYPCDFRWRGQTVRNVGIRSRGTGSRSGIKPGLRVDFDRYTTDQKFLGLKSFVLRNNTQDASNLRERLSMLLFRRLGLPASREAHTTLYVNDEYVGLYTIVESVDKAFLKRVFNEDGGYLYEYDFPPGAQPYYFENHGSDPSLYVPLPFKPETHEDDPQPEVIAELVQAINDTSDAVFRTAVAQYLDLAKFVRHVAVEVFIAELDGFLGDYGMNNYYFYRFENQKLFTFIAWDKSEAFKGGPDYGIFHNITDVPAARQNRLMRRTLTYRDLIDLYLDSLMACVQSAGETEEGSPNGPGWLAREIEHEYSQIRDSALADPVKPFSNEEFERDVDSLRVFATGRGDSVTRQINQTRATLATRAPRRRW
jgi:spore coat protein CotH